MKGKKLEFILLLVVVMVGIWFLVFRSYTRIDEKQKQKELLKQADVYAEDELYVRALPLYKEALSVDAGEENRLVVEEKLLAAYEGFKDFEGYKSIVDMRIEEGVATEPEYLEVIKYYLALEDIKQALEYIVTGRKNFPDSEELEQKYEENRYRYRAAETDWEMIYAGGKTGRLMVNADSVWNYCDVDGDTVFTKDFDAVTPFYKKDDGSYAVVRQDGEYFVINEDGQWYSRDHKKLEDVKGISNGLIIGKQDGKYSFYSMDFEPLSDTLQFDDLTFFSCGAAAIKQGKLWGILSEEGEILSDFQYEEVALNSTSEVFVNDYAMVKQDGRWFLVNTKGERVFEGDFADAKAPESGDWIAVADEDGQWGFVDAEGNLKIDYQYKDAKSFSDQLAAVETVSGWGYISKKNEFAIDGDFHLAEPFHQGTAIIKMIEEEAGFITLEYTEGEK